MGAKRARARVAWAVGIGAVLGAYGLAACEGDDTNPPRAGSSSGSSGNVDATVEGGDQDTGTVDPAMCSRYGGYQGVQGIADEIITAAKADCRIGDVFNGQNVSVTHVQQCFEKQLGTFFGCPGVVYDKDSAGNRCRGMNEAHQNLGLRQADFNAFITDALAVLKKHQLSDNDYSTIRSSMLGTQAAVVRAGGPGNADCTCPNLEYDGGYCGIPDAGLDGAKDTGTDAPPDTGITDAADEG